MRAQLNSSTDSKGDFNAPRAQARIFWATTTFERFRAPLRLGARYKAPLPRGFSTGDIYPVID